jgi:ribosomal protein S18 acetylase RimI-like enzyme
MITKATLNDVSELNVLVNSAYRGDNSKKGWTTEANILTGVRIDDEELIDLMNESKSNIFKFTENNKILGCVLLVEKANKLYLGMLCVNPDIQNSGIGKKILKFANEFAIKKSLPKIVMTVISSRIELINWYNRHGFFDTGEREPFPENHAQDVISGEKLEFIVLEKLVF